MTENRYGAAWTRERSLKASVKDAWYLFALHLKKEFRALAPFVLLVAMLGAFFAEMCRMYVADVFLPMIRMAQAGADDDVLGQVLLGGVWQMAGGLVSALLLVLALYWYYGRVFRFLKASASGRGMEDVVKHPVLKREDRRLAWRMFSVDLASALLNVVVSMAVGALALHWSWMSLVTVPFAVYYTVAVRAARHEYVFEEKTYGASLKLGYGKEWGRAFILDVVCMWPVLAVRMVALLPLAVGFYATLMATDSWLMGDGIQMPGALPFLFFVLNTLGFAVCLVSGVFMVYARSMRLHRVVDPAEKVQ